LEETIFLVAHATFEKMNNHARQVKKKGKLESFTPSNGWMKEDHLKKPRASK